MVTQKDLTFSLDEKSFLDSLKQKHEHQTIYTQCGTILLSVNPFSELQIYDKSVMKAYCKNYNLVEPHVYSIAESCVQNLTINNKQTIIVSGESGSGKTVNSEHILKYLIWRCEGSSQLENLLLVSHFILECFGNAKTQINENSSRFGKYMSFYLEDERIVGGRISEYLLEKSRFTHQTNGNDNFHVCYCVCVGREVLLKNDYIDVKYSDEYLKKYLKLKEIFENNKLIDFEVVCNKLIAILKLGSVMFEENGDGLVILNDELFSEICKILDLSSETLKNSMLKNKFVCKDECVVRNNTLTTALNIRDTLARNLYANLFRSIIDDINSKLGRESETVISILDIYGFEVFDFNDLDQFCINWANERIQNEFIKRMFVDRQKFYNEEEVEWPEIDFPTNDSILNLIEQKCGIADLIEEESYSPCGSTLSLHIKLQKYNSNKKNFLPTTSPNTMKIGHFAYPVEYNLENFIDKNTESFKFSEISGNICGIKENQSVIKYFISSMNTLFEKINKTEIHYLRCIRANKQKKAWYFDKEHVSKQIRACGVMETILLGQLTYPFVMSKERFAEKYNFENHYCDVKTGKTSIFMKADTKNKLEELRYMRSLISNFLKKQLLKKWIQEFTDKHHQKILDSQPFILLEPETDILKTLDNIDCKIKETDLKDEIALLRKAIQENQSFYKKCTNCDTLKQKYELQIESLKVHEKIKDENESLKQFNRRLDLELAAHKDLIRDITLIANEPPKQVIKDTETPTLQINFTNPHEVFGCLIDLYIENTPTFSEKTYPTDELLSLAHLTYKISDEMASRSKASLESFLNIFLYELNERICKFDTNIQQVCFIFSNLVELKALISRSNQELVELISSLFEHLCELQKTFLGPLLPDSVIYYQALNDFKTEDSFFRKYFNKTPSIFKLINQVEYLFCMMSYYGLPIDYAHESLRYNLNNLNVICFNRILVEKDFLCFKRCTQITYNLNEITKFCQEISFLEGIDSFSQLKDVTLLVFMVKNNLPIQNIVEQCVFLNELQIKMLITKTKEANDYVYSDIKQERIFLDEPTLIVPALNVKHEPVFCLPRYLSPKQITSILSSI